MLLSVSRSSHVPPATRSRSVLFESLQHAGSQRITWLFRAPAHASTRRARSPRTRVTTRPNLIVSSFPRRLEPFFTRHAFTRCPSPQEAPVLLFRRDTTNGL